MKKRIKRNSEDKVNTRTYKTKNLKKYEAKPNTMAIKDERSKKERRNTLICDGIIGLVLL